LTGEQGPLHLLYLLIFFLIKKYLDIINIFYNKNKNKNKNLNDVDKKSILNNKIKKIN
jgi:hypothetical protein